MVHLVILGVMVLIIVGKEVLDTPGAEQQPPVQVEEMQHSPEPEMASRVGALDLRDNDPVDQVSATLQRNASHTGQ